MNSLNEKKKGLFKHYLKLWSATSKFIRHQVEKGRIVDSRLFGKFYKSGISEKQVLYIPSSDFLDVVKVRISKND